MQLMRPSGFSLRAAAEFYAGFTPGSGLALAEPEALTLSFRLDRSFEAVAVRLQEAGDHLVAEHAGTEDLPTLQRQITRMLGLDADGAAWRALGESEPAVGALQREFPGFFTAAKPSPYDAACWGVLSPRMQMPQAARLKIRMGELHGDVVTLRGRGHPVFPSPTQLQAIESFPGLSEEKLARLKGIGAAALAGKLDPDMLRALSPEVALAALQELPGVGPWTASHILYRGAALVDALPTAEPRVLHGVGAVYGIAPPDAAAYQALGERWRPFRMWVCVLVARHLARIGGWQNPAFKKERAVAGRRLARG